MNISNYINNYYVNNKMATNDEENVYLDVTGEPKEKYRNDMNDIINKYRKSKGLPPEKIEKSEPFKSHEDIKAWIDKIKKENEEKI